MVRSPSGGTEEAYLAKRIKYVIEEDKDLPFRHFGNVVHTLAGVVAHSGILIRKGSQHWWHDVLQISSNFFLASIASQNTLPKLMDRKGKQKRRT